MKHMKLLILFLALAAVAVACKPAEEKPAAANREATLAEFDKLKKETKEAGQQIQDYAYAQKAQFVTNMQARIAELNRDLDQLAARLEKSSDAAKAEAKPKLQALREQAARLKQHLDEANGATESTWGDVQRVFHKGYSELKDGFQQARQWVSDKIAP